MFVFQDGCRLRRPPGCEIYRHGDGSLSLYEVDGSTEDSTTTEYCVNLLLLAELFIPHDSLLVCATAPTTLLQFYVLTQHIDDRECLIGFFVKVRSSVTCSTDVIFITCNLWTTSVY